MSSIKDRLFDEIELQDCPLCNGAASLEEEYGWCYYVTCVDCDCHTVEIEFKSEEGREEAAKKAAYLWNIGKIICGNPNE